MHWGALLQGCLLQAAWCGPVAEICCAMLCAVAGRAALGLAAPAAHMHAKSGSAECDAEIECQVTAPVGGRKEGAAPWSQVAVLCKRCMAWW